MIDKIFNLSIFFAEVLNKTTSTGSGTDLSAEMKTYYEKRLIELAEPELIHDQFGDKYPIPKGNGKTIEFRKFSSLAKATMALTEGVSPDGKNLNVTAMTATVNQYGDVVRLTDMLEMTAIDPIQVQAMKAIASQAGRTLDTITRETLNAGTNVLFAPSVSGSTVTATTARANITDKCLLRVDDIRRAVLQLRRYNAPKIDGSYVAIVHPDVANDLRSDKDNWIDVVKYKDPEKIYNGEIGTIGGCRIIENTEAKIFTAAGASSGDSGARKYNVYSTLVFGAGAYAVTEVTGGGLQYYAKQKGSAGTADPIDQRSTVGWKAIKVAKILVQEYMVRIESSSANESTAVAN